MLIRFYEFPDEQVARVKATGMATKNKYCEKNPAGQFIR